jgi:hypothetical protein
MLLYFVAPTVMDLHGGSGNDLEFPGGFRLVMFSLFLLVVEISFLEICMNLVKESFHAKQQSYIAQTVFVHIAIYTNSVAGVFSRELCLVALC